MSGLTDKDLALLNMGSYDQPHYHASAVGKGWIVDDELTTPESTVYHNEITKHSVIAFRGTAEKKDLKTDALLFLGIGGKSNRYKQSNELADRVISKYGQQNTSLTGHSLGADIASNVSKNKNLDAVSFSKGRKLLPSKNAPRERVIRAVGDPFSGSAVIPSAFSLPNLILGGGGRIPDLRKGHPHSLQQFIYP